MARKYRRGCGADELPPESLGDAACRLLLIGGLAAGWRRLEPPTRLSARDWAAGLACLPVFERSVLILRLVWQLSPRRIGALLGYTGPRAGAWVSMRLASAMRRLRAHPECLRVLFGPDGVPAPE